MNIVQLTNLPSWTITALIIFLAWIFFWKAVALWQSARHGSSLWFGVFLVVNTLGILEIIYLFKVLKLKRSELFQ